MSKQSKTIILGTLGVAAAAGFAFYKVFQSQTKPVQESNQLNVLDRQKVITILKEMKKEFYTVFQNFAAISQNIKQQTMGRAKPTEIKMMVLEQPMFRGEIDTIEQQVYEKYGTNKREFEYACSHTYKEDPTVKQLSKDMKDSFDRAFQGLAPDSKTDIPAFLTPELAIEILEKIMMESAMRLNEKLLELQEAGEQISYNNPKMMEVMQTLKMDSSKKDILKSYNLDVYDDSGSQILQFATQTYTKSNVGGFNDKMNKLDIKYQQIMEVLLTSGAMSNQDLQLKLRQEPKRAQGGMFGFPAADHQQFEPEVQQENEDQFANNEEPKQDGPSLKVEENQPEKYEQHQPPQDQGQPQGQIHEVEHVEKHEVEHVEKHDVEHVEKHEKQEQKNDDLLIKSVDDESEKFQSVIQH
ncbi:hypothetical protein pb186bvf_012142 [Paramecium bursaria]